MGEQFSLIQEAHMNLLSLGNGCVPEALLPVNDLSIRVALFDILAQLIQSLKKANTIK